jgi:hypothetical protein
MVPGAGKAESSKERVQRPRGGGEENSKLKNYKLKPYIKSKNQSSGLLRRSRPGLAVTNSGELKAKRR